MVGEGHPLQVTEDLRAEVELQLLSRQHGQILLHRHLQLVRERDEDSEGRHQNEKARRRARRPLRQQGIQEAGQRAGAQHRVHGDLERERRQERQRAGEEADQEQHGHEVPRRGRLARETAVEGQVVHHGRSPPPSSRNTHANAGPSARKAQYRGAAIGRRDSIFS